MTKVFVHGVPETAAIWQPLIAALARLGVDDIVTVSPPGFGAPVPPNWSATPAAYVDWLVAEIESLGGPVDLVGHDWGTGHVLGVVAARSDLVKSWAIDIAGLVHPDYEWHDMAQVFQTPGAGEEVVGAMAGMPSADLAAAYIEQGMDPAAAQSMAEALDGQMAECILGLYRAAVQPHLRELGDRVAEAQRIPSLIINATDDAYVPSSLTPDVAGRLGSSVLNLDGQGHWWMLSDPATAAQGLISFWR